jgi:hypothetical protein
MSDKALKRNQKKEREVLERKLRDARARHATYMANDAIYSNNDTVIKRHLLKQVQTYEEKLRRLQA